MHRWALLVAACWACVFATPVGRTAVPLATHAAGHPDRDDPLAIVDRLRGPQVESAGEGARRGKSSTPAPPDALLPRLIEFAPGRGFAFAQAPRDGERALYVAARPRSPRAPPRVSV